MRHRFRRGMLAALIAGVTFFYPLLAPTPHRIDETHFRQIQPGMTRAQVEAIFGAPPGEYDWAESDGDGFLLLIDSGLIAMGGETANHYHVTSAILNRDPNHQSIWTSRHGTFGIYFGENERVSWTNHRSEVRIVPPWQRAWQWWKSN